MGWIESQEDKAEAQRMANLLMEEGWLVLKPGSDVREFLPSLLEILTKLDRNILQEELIKRRKELRLLERCKAMIPRTKAIKKRPLPYDEDDEDDEDEF